MRAWVRAALLVGVLYFVIGIVFAVQPAHISVRAWRLAAWVISAVVFGTQVLYEHSRLRQPPRSTAWHAGLAVAIGAFALAVSGAVRTLMVTSTLQATWLLALLVWPVAIGLPAFGVALVATVVLTRLSRSG